MVSAAAMCRVDSVYATRLVTSSVILTCGSMSSHFLVSWAMLPSYLGYPWHVAYRLFCVFITGAVQQKRSPWRASIVTDLFWGIINLIVSL